MGAERLVDLRQKTVQLAEEAVKTSEGLFNVGASDKPDLLEVEIEAERAKLEFAAAQSHRTTVWRQLAALAGKPDLEPAPLAGDFDRSIPAVDPDSALEAILRDSPELKAARLGALRAQSAVALARSKRIPDIQARAGFRYNRELLEAGGRPVGWEAFADVGIQIPLFNRNQGNILAASSRASYADQEVRRVDLAIRARFDQWLDRYKNSQRVVDAYRSAIIPRAEQAHRLYLEKFREMAAAYPQVLIAQRALLQVEGQYISAVVDLWKAAIPLQGFLLTDGLSEARVQRDPGEAYNNESSDERR
jgi:cobalt-zinc-cadmium efflux system outer membrane protein